MLWQKILKNLENGNYRIEYREKCDCGFYWLEKGDNLECVTVNNDGCWYGNVLIMDDLAGEFDDVTIVNCDGVIAVYDNFYGVSVQICCLSQNIVKKIERYIREDVEIWCDFIASINYPNKYNELHFKRRDKSLIEYVEWKIEGDKK